MARVISITFTVIKMLTPVIAWLAVESIKAMCLALISLWQGVPNTCRGVANEWVADAIKRGFPTIWENILRRVFVFVAFAFVVLGWILLAYATTFLLAIVF